MADVSSESEPEPASFMDEVQRIDAEATYGFPRYMALGYRWVFIVKKGAQNITGLEKWFIKPNQ